MAKSHKAPAKEETKAPEARKSAPSGEIKTYSVEFLKDGKWEKQDTVKAKNRVAVVSKISRPSGTFKVRLVG